LYQNQIAVRIECTYDVVCCKVTYQDFVSAKFCIDAGKSRYLEISCGLSGEYTENHDQKT